MIVAVTGASGQQGGAVTRALLGAGVRVRAIVRDVRKAPEGAEVRVATFDDLGDAFEGVDAVFAMQTPQLTDLMGDSEVRHARNMAAAAVKAGVRHIVQTSVSGAGEKSPDAETWGPFMAHYWRSKAECEDAVKVVPRWTVLRPAAFMENFLPGSYYYRDGKLAVAVDLDVPVPLIAIDDIGTAAVKAFADPERFHAKEIELAGDKLSFRDVATILGVEIGGRPEEHFAISQKYMTEHVSPALPEHAKEYGIETTPFREWAGKRFKG